MIFILIALLVLVWVVCFFVIIHLYKEVKILNNALLRLENPVAARAVTIATEGVPEPKPRPPTPIGR